MLEHSKLIEYLEEQDYSKIKPIYSMHYSLIKIINLINSINFFIVAFDLVADNVNCSVVILLPIESISDLYKYLKAYLEVNFIQFNWKDREVMFYPSEGKKVNLHFHSISNI